MDLLTFPLLERTLWMKVTSLPCLHIFLHQKGLPELLDYSRTILHPACNTKLLWEYMRFGDGSILRLSAREAIEKIIGTSKVLNNIPVSSSKTTFQRIMYHMQCRTSKLYNTWSRRIFQISSFNTQFTLGPSMDNPTSFSNFSDPIPLFKHRKRSVALHVDKNSEVNQLVSIKPASLFKNLTLISI